MDKEYVMALDQETTSCRAILSAGDGTIAGIAHREFTQYYPKPGLARAGSPGELS